MRINKNEILNYYVNRHVVDIVSKQINVDVSIHYIPSKQHRYYTDCEIDRIFIWTLFVHYKMRKIRVKTVHMRSLVISKLLERTWRRLAYT